MNDALAEIIDLGFSVADGERIKLSYADQTLRVSFLDWQEKLVSFICHDAIAFRWQEAEYVLSDQEGMTRLMRLLVPHGCASTRSRT